MTGAPAAAATAHTSVLRDEVLAGLMPQAGGLYVDATLGAGGHAAALLAASAPTGRVIGIDRDPAALALTAQRLGDAGGRLQLVHGNFADLPVLLAQAGAPVVDGLVADLGVSSMQLDRAERGFSFRHAGPLDMRMDPGQGESVLALLRRLDADALADLLFVYGEERRSRRIARAILAALADGELATTADLAQVVRQSHGGPPRRRIDPATRTFQALRIAVNDELAALEALLAALPQVLRVGGRAALIAFHSLEDRRVKWSLRQSVDLRPLTKRPIVPTEMECARNRRARSAKLRIAERLPRAAALPELGGGGVP
ncbi:MAG: 16S rRNA (cytosine(1402)-N(4))-methyltransferase RsmH [Polyangiales bacterium]